MGFHLAAFKEDTAAPTTQYTLKPVTDMYFPSTTSGFLLPSAMSIVAAYARSARDGSDASSGGGGLARAVITAPSLLRVAYPYIRPVSRSTPEGTDPNVMSLVSHPLMLPASENVGVQATLSAAPQNTGGITALLWFSDGLVQAPAGEAYTLRFATSSAAASTGGAWSPVGTVNFDQSLPPGAYSVIGFEHWSATAIAARLVFPGMHMRPGTLSMGGTGTFPSDKRTDRLFYEGGLGVYGTFNSFAPPSIEVLTILADTTHEAYLTVVRTGDAAPIGSASSGAPLR